MDQTVSKINIFGLKMMVKGGVEKTFMKSLDAQSLFQKLFFTSWKGGFYLKIASSVIKMTSFPYGWISIKMYVNIINATNFIYIHF